MRDRDDVDVLARDGGEDAAGDTGSAMHAFADHGQQSDVFLHVDGTQVSVRELERQG